MATTDVLAATISQLQSLATPAVNAAQITVLQNQITNLTQQLATANAQLAALQTADSLLAQRVIQALNQILPNRVGINVDITGPTPIVTVPPARGVIAGLG